MTDTPNTPDIDDEQKKHDALDARMRRVMEAENVDGALAACSRYPQLEDRKLTKFEDDVRDWGLIYGIAYGLGRADADYGGWDDTGELVADRAYRVARGAWERWADEIEDPAVVQERAVRDVIRAFEHAQKRAWKEQRYDKTEQMMTPELRNALGEFELVMKGEA